MTDRKEFLPDTNIEICNPNIERGKMRHVIFDFDGTLSLVREGWQKIMIPMGVEFLQETGTDETEEQLTAVVDDFVLQLTGKQTIYQMIELAEQVKKRGGTPKEPLEYKNIYLDRLWEKIKHRVEGLKSGEYKPEEFIMPGGYELLNALKERGCTMYLASGTDHKYVVDESEAIKVADYFGEYIYGALDDYKKVSKKIIIQKIIKDNNLSGPELLAFGDGFVEIEDTKAVGGVAVGVASDEVELLDVDDWKRNRLIQAEADMIIPHFREWQPLIKYLFNE